MASEYLKKKFQDVKPETKREMTKGERIKNWWLYHWYLVLIAIGAAALIVVICVEWIFVTRPDYRIAYVSRAPLSVEPELLSEALEKLANDRNGDGEIEVQIKSYYIDESSAAYESDIVALGGDVSVENSEIYLVDDVQWFAGQYGIFAEEDAVYWQDCPALTAIDPDAELYVALRTYQSQSQREKKAYAQALFDAMTAK